MLAGLKPSYPTFQPVILVFPKVCVNKTGGRSSDTLEENGACMALILSYRWLFSQIDFVLSQSLINSSSQLRYIFGCRLAASTNEYTFPKAPFPSSLHNAENGLIPRKLCKVSLLLSPRKSIFAGSNSLHFYFPPHSSPILS